jgi:hypothetical protein
MKMNKKRSFFAAALLLSSTSFISHATVMLNGFGGDAGYGELAMPRNDDGSSNQLDLPFDINFFGNTYNQFFINNNGNLTFDSPVSSYTPSPFPVTNQAMIAPFWADVDTSCTTCGEVYVGSPSEGTVAITWNNVGVYPASDNGLRNSFQAVIIDRSADNNAGDFDVEFRYDNLTWTSGSASGGDGEVGGSIHAQAGYDAGNDSDFYALPGSFSEDVLALQNTSNTGEDGVWRFAIRDGALPGETPENPIMPVVTDNGWAFDFNVDLNEQIFIDPDVAVGYDYFSDSGDNFASVLLPTGFDDNSFDLWLMGNNGWEFSDTILGGVDYDFANGGVSEFRIMGIDIANMVDPENTGAFVTGLTFTGAGQQQIRQVAVTEFVNTQVDEPNALILLLLSLGLLSFANRKKNAK